MKIVFFGSSKYSTIVQKALNEKFGIVLCVTAPDKPKGRQRKLTPTAVKEFALKNKMDVIAPAKLDKTAIENIAKLKPDFLAVCDYGLILSTDILKIPNYDALNVHHSLLPKYRGPTPAPSAILAGEKKSGVTIISMSEDVDAGDILEQKDYSLRPDETTDSLLTVLNKLGAQLVIQVIENYLSFKGDSLKGKRQDHTQATYTHRLKKKDGEINLENPPDSERLNRMMRAFHPWPGVWTKVKVKSGKSIIIKFLPPHQIPNTRYQIPFVIQPEGKKPMTVAEFKNGYPELFRQFEKLLSKN